MPSLMSLSQIPQSSFKAPYRHQTTTESSKLGTMYISWAEKFDLLSFFQNLEIWPSLWRHGVKIEPKGAKPVYYIPTVIKRSNSITMAFSRLVTDFWDQFLKIMILWIILNTSFWRHSKVGSQDAQICISRAIGEESSKPIGNGTLRWGKSLWG